MVIDTLCVKPPNYNVVLVITQTGEGKKITLHVKIHFCSNTFPIFFAKTFVDFVRFTYFQILSNILSSLDLLDPRNALKNPFLLYSPKIQHLSVELVILLQYTFWSNIEAWFPDRAASPRPQIPWKAMELMFRKGILSPGNRLSNGLYPWLIQDV